MSPALPAGLTLDPTSGVISGTPLAASPGDLHRHGKQCGRRSDGSPGLGGTRATIALTYTSPVTGTVGAALTPLVPTLSGDADTFQSNRRFRTD